MHFIGTIYDELSHQDARIAVERWHARQRRQAHKLARSMRAKRSAWTLRRTGDERKVVYVEPTRLIGARGRMVVPR